MSKFRFHLSISADGYAAGPSQSEEDPLGVGGEQLHEWVFPLEAWRKPHGKEGGEVNASTSVVEELQRNVGAGVMGLAIALDLLEEGHDVTVLEAAFCGYGPSGRNGGFLESYWCALERLRERVGDTGALALARASERVQTYLDGGEVTRTIVVPGKLVSFVT